MIGRKIRVNEQPATVIGVMPKSFRMPNREDVWIPLAPAVSREARDSRGLLVVGLMKPA